MFSPSPLRHATLVVSEIPNQGNKMIHKVFYAEAAEIDTYP
jgi:hypothetical protein